MSKLYEVHCGMCNWWGFRKSMHSELGCPMCLSDEYIEYAQDRLSYLSDKVNVVREKQKQLLDILIQLDKDMVH